MNESYESYESFESKMPKGCARIVRWGGKELMIVADGARSLLDVARRELGLRDLAKGCGDGSCGVCRVLVNGELVASCMLRWCDFPDGGVLETHRDVQRSAAVRRTLDAFREDRPTRCNLCVPALAVTAAYLEREGKARHAEAVDECLEDATCQCTGRGSLRRSLLA